MKISEIHGLRYDYIQQNGHYLIIQHPDPHRWQTSHLASVSLNMMKWNEIPGIVPLHIESLNLQHSIYYNIDNRKMLRPALMQYSLNVEDLCRLTQNIIAILEESALYMLDEDRYLLHEDFIFYEQDMYDVSLVYLPVQLAPDWPTPIKQLRTMINRIGTDVEGVISLVTFLEQEHITLQQIKQKLHEILDNKIGTQEQSFMEKKPISSDYPSTHNKIEGQMNGGENEVTEDIWMKEDSVESSCADDLYIEGSLSFIPTNQIMEYESNQGDSDSGFTHLADMPVIQKTFQPLTWRQNIYLGILLLAVVIWIWSEYVQRPGEGWFYISVGLTILLGNAAFVLSVIWRPRLQMGKRYAKHDQPMLAGDPYSLHTTIDAANEIDLEDDAHYRSMKNSDTVDGKGSLNPEEYYDLLRHQTTVLHAPHRTVMLGLSDYIQDQSQQQKRYYLEVSGPQSNRRVELMSEQSFIIGREHDKVHFVQDETGVSRVHAQIINEAEQYYVQDLGSANGSYLNGLPMVAYKQYPFQPGDQLIIIQTEYTLKHA